MDDLNQSGGPRARVRGNSAEHAELSVSVVIPCYNGSKFLGQAIESALGQTRPPLEVIVVDDCSSDNSRELASRYPVTVLRTPRNGGPAAARNYGIRAARGDLIASLDQDDAWEPHHLATVAALLDRFPEAAVAFSAIELMTEEGLPMEGGWGPYFPAGRPVHVAHSAFLEVPGPAPTSVFRRAAVLAVGGYTAGVISTDDADLWLRMAQEWPFVCVHEATCRYRVHGGQVSSDLAGQRASFYENRARFVAGLAARGDHGRAADLEALLWEEWERDLSDYWYTRNFAGFDRFYAARAILSGKPGARTLRRWWPRAHTPRALIRLLDRVRGGS